MAIGDGRDLEATRAQLEDWWRRRACSGAAVSISNVRAPGMGFSNETLLFDVESAGPEGIHREHMVVRFKPHAQVFPEYDLARQYRIMELLAATDVPVPQVRWFEPDESLFGAPFYVMDRLEGVVPPDHPTYHVGGCCTEMSPASRQTLWWDGLEKMTRIHRLDWRATGLGFLDEPRWGADPLGQQLAYYTHFLEWAANGRPQPICGPALQWLQANRPVPGSEPVGVCWGDSRIGNMIFADDRCVAVLDWEMASLGNPEQDLAWWLFLDWHHSTGIGVDRLEGFPSREETIARYEELIGRKVEHQFYYEVFAAFRFAVIMIRVADNVVAAGIPAPPDLGSDNVCTRRLAELLGLGRS